MVEAPWTPDEHNLFLQGYLIYGKSWFEIAELVRTRNAYQVAVYANWLEQHGCLPRLPPIEQYAAAAAAALQSANAASAQQTVKSPVVKPIAPAAKTPTTISIDSTATPKTEIETNKGNWTKEEHDRFLKGLAQHGKGKWKEIAAMVGTRSIKQTYNHGKTHFNKLEKSLDASVSGSKRKAPEAETPNASKKKAATSKTPTVKTTITPSVSKLTGVRSDLLSLLMPTAKPKANSANKQSNSTLDIQPPVVKKEDTKKKKSPKKSAKKAAKSVESKKSKDFKIGAAMPDEMPIADDPGDIITSSRKKLLITAITVNLLLLLAGTAIVYWESLTGTNVVGKLLGVEVNANEADDMPELTVDTTTSEL